MLIREKNTLNQYSTANLREKERISINQLNKLRRTSCQRKDKRGRNQMKWKRKSGFDISYL